MRIKSTKMKFFTVIILGVYLFLLYIFYSVWLPRVEPAKVKLSYVILHLDLKGAPPNLSYLHFLLPMLKENGVNGLLMEYEDMFPYERKLANLSAKNSYDQKDLRKFISKAVQLGFEIIPLIQTFGHLEFALKLQDFKHLRENPAYPDSICPSNTESRIMVKDMLKQVLSFHNKISPLKYIHVGCDEVYHMNKCRRCKNTGLTNLALFLDHIQYLSDVIRGFSPETTVLIWDDMLRKIDQPVWQNIARFDNVEPVYWEYTPNLSLAHLRILNYHKKFKNIWAASAFKGADGPTVTIPDLKARLLNHFSWMNLMRNFKISGESKIFHFKGFILTGWSRYSHMDPMCELLPVSIPSLILNLRMIKKYKSGVNIYNHKNIRDVYAFYSKYLNGNDIHFRCDMILNTDSINPSTCYFEGNELYSILKQYVKLENDEIYYLHNSAELLSAEEYYLYSKNSNLNRLMPKMSRFNDTLNNLKVLEKNMVRAMKKYYSDYVIQEYVSFKTFFIKKQIAHLVKVSQTYMTFDRVWERGPPSNFTEVSIN